jgi:ribonuclease BN (tRNA processing enzyme)
MMGYGAIQEAMSSSSSSMTLRFFGAGGAFSRRYGTTCSALGLRSAALWLIDCGRQAPDQLASAGLSWHDIAGQIVTHVHGDHVFGMEDFAFLRYFSSNRGVDAIREGGPRPKLVCHSAVREELWQVLSPSLRYLAAPTGPTTTGVLTDYFEVIEPEGSEPPRDNPWTHAESFVLPELRLVARETEHVPYKPSTSLEIRVGEGDDERVAWWSGDSTVQPDLLVALEPRVTVFFHDCTFMDYPGQVHGAFHRLEQLPEAVRRKMVLMHHEDDLETHRARAEAAGFRIGLPDQTYDLTTGQRIG